MRSDGGLPPRCVMSAPRGLTGDEELGPVPFLDADDTVTVRRGLELCPTGFLGNHLQDTWAFIFADEDGVDGHAEIFCHLALGLHLPIPLRRHTVCQEEDVLVPWPQALEFREGIFQRVLVIRASRAVQMQRP